MTLSGTNSVCKSSRAKQKPPITRFRESLACTSCRARKLKCDKIEPCGSCVRRDDAANCVYHKSAERERHGTKEQRVNAEARLEHLEVLVKQLVKAKDAPDKSIITPPEHSPPASEKGGSSSSDQEDSTRPVYTGSTHWSAVLDDLKELKEIIRSDAEDDDYLDSPDTVPGLDYDILFGGPQNITLEGVLANYMAIREEMDRCIEIYFSTRAIVAPFLHMPQFMRQYQQFWENPLQTSPLWISILFSMAHLSTKVDNSDETSPELGPLIHHRKDQFLVGAAHCLTLGRYHQTRPLAVEAFTIYVQCRCTSSLDPSREIGVLIGIMTQLALMSGYHRDPENMPNLTPFQKEMRRRTWSFALQFDLLVAFQLGIPSGIQALSWDTKLPANLWDDDFDEDTIVMPADRPATQITKLAFYISKSKLMFVFEKIFRHALASNYYNEVDLIDLERELNDTYLAMPPAMRSSCSGKWPKEEAYSVASLHCVVFIYQKCMCVLHRKYASRGRVDSIEACTDAALNMSKTFHEMYEQFKPKGLLYSQRWLFSAILWNDYLLAVNLMCLLLVTQSQSQSQPHDKTAKMEARQMEMEEQLKAAYRVCMENRAASRGAQRVRHLLHAVLSHRGVVFGMENLTMTGITSQQQLLLQQQQHWPHLENSRPGGFTGSAGPDEFALLGQPLVGGMDMESYSMSLTPDATWDDQAVQILTDEEWRSLGQAANLPGVMSYWGGRS